MIRQNYNDLCMEERPQYRAYNYGMDTLSNVELLSLVMNRGAGTKESLQQARQIYNIMGESLRNIKRARIEELEVVQGVGDCKAIAIQAAIELGRRYQMEKVARQTDLGSSLALYNFLLPQMEDNEKERFFVVLMNQNFRLIKCIKLSEGNSGRCTIDNERSGAQQCHHLSRGA